jgi:hypothetical protein
VRIHVGDPEVVSELIRYFESQADCIVLQVGLTEIEVSLLGSYRQDRHDAAVERKLAAFWARSNGTLHRNDTGATPGNGKRERGPAPAA